jgi:protein-L-isoaspartate O-methyltransferase
MLSVSCGYGTFSIPVAARIRGTLDTFDIERPMVETTLRRATRSGVGNIRATVADVASGYEVRGVDAVLLFSILRAETPVSLLQQAQAAIHSTGRILAIHWRSDVETPRGPDLSIRPMPDQIALWAKGIGLKSSEPILLPPWHFGLVLSKL